MLNGNCRFERGFQSLVANNSHLLIYIQTRNLSPGVCPIYRGKWGPNWGQDIVVGVEPKESNSTANESKRHYNRSIIYYLNIAPIVNDSFWNSSKKKKEKWSCRDSNSRQGKCSAHVKVGCYTIAPQSSDICNGK